MGKNDCTGVGLRLVTREETVSEKDAKERMIGEERGGVSGGRNGMQ